MLCEVDMVLPPQTSLTQAHDVGEAAQYAIEELEGVDRFVAASLSLSKASDADLRRFLPFCLPLTIQRFRAYRVRCLLSYSLFSSRHAPVSPLFTSLNFRPVFPRLNFGADSSFLFDSPYHSVSVNPLSGHLER
jgi:hypothetical protein